MNLPSPREGSRVARFGAIAFACCLVIGVAYPANTRAQTTPTPVPSAATPWPAPTGLRLEQSVQVTSPDGSFVPSAQRQATSSLTWDAVPGFAGPYVLERARAAYGATGPRQWEGFATVTGTWFVEEPYPFLDLLAFQRCYRVATALDGLAGAFSTEVCTVAPPTSAPEPSAEPSFNYDVVREVVVPLFGNDGRTHYVTLSQDTAGVVRVRLSLFDFTPLTYNIVLFRRGDCSQTANYGPEDVIRPNVSFTVDSVALVVQFFNTGSITLTAGPKSIYDADGTSLAVYRPGSGGTGLLAACAVLAGPPGAPDTGTGPAGPSGVRPRYRDKGAVVAAAMLATAAGLFAMHRRARRPN